jgi:hypothetical protein
MDTLEMWAARIEHSRQYDPRMTDAWVGLGPLFDAQWYEGE